jgi:hypothetical protein
VVVEVEVAAVEEVEEVVAAVVAVVVAMGTRSSRLSRPVWHRRPHPRLRLSQFFLRSDGSLR